MQYIINIEEEPIVNMRKNLKLYRAAGFSSLVFDEYGLKHLTPLGEYLDKVKQDAFDTGYSEGFKQGFASPQKSESHGKYWDSVTAIKDKQTKKGLAEYGQTLEENYSLPAIDRLTMLEEEMVDALMYIEHLKAMYNQVCEPLKREDYE